MAAFLLLALLGNVGPLAAYPVGFVDSSGSQITVLERPRKIISLVPAITGIIFQLGAGDSLGGLTYQDTLPPEANQKRIVGSFLAPSLVQMDDLEPDVVFLSSLHQEVRDHFAGRPCRMIDLESHSLADLYQNVLVLGAMFDREGQAKEIVESLRNKLQLISNKVDKIPQDKRKRVMRFMGLDRVMTPGDDSFQNELIRAAGGIPPQLGKKGNAVEVTLEEWTRFDPQVIYGCGGDRELAEKFFSQPGWKDVDAVRMGRIAYFPCALTCRASVHTGEFVAWLASTVYEEQFAAEQNRVLPEKRVWAQPVEIALDYVRSARVDESTIFDFPNKTLVVEFKEPMRVTSTLEGERKGILAVGNHYTPPPCWSIMHRLGFDDCRNHIYKAIGKSKGNSCFLFTGADMGNLSMQKAQFKDMIVYALVTAGVEGNAVRMSVDEGRFYEPGTINVILMTNMKLSSRARTRAIISATEAKTAAMEDMDVRSSASPQRNQATGTGTDEVLVVEGKGTPIDNAGGHCKMGELIAKAVYDGVKEAVYRQNGIAARRNVFRRLQERHLDLQRLLEKSEGPVDQHKGRRDLAPFEELLLQPRFASFIEAAFALSDAYERGQIATLELIEWWCQNVADEIAGTRIKKRMDYITSSEVPIVMRMSLNALLNGLAAKEKQ